MPDASPIFVPTAKLRQLTEEGVEKLKAAVVSDGPGGLFVSVEAYEDAVRYHRRPLSEVPADYDPAKHRDAGRCCS